MHPVRVITESLESNLTLLDHFITMSSHKLGIMRTEPSDSALFVHPAYVNRPIYRFPTKNTPANFLRQGIVYDSITAAQNRCGSQQANQFNRANATQNRNMRGMNYPFNQQKNKKAI